MEDGIAMRNMSIVNEVGVPKTTYGGSGMLLAYSWGKHGDALGGFKAEEITICFGETVE